MVGGATDPKAARGAARDACAGTLLAYCQAWQDYMGNLDYDGDLVPDWLEQRLAATRGCGWTDRESCSGRPPGTINLEKNAYEVGWSRIKGKADNEGWSRCGKQWGDAGVCTGASSCALRKGIIEETAASVAPNRQVARTMNARTMGASLLSRGDFV